MLRLEFVIIKLISISAIIIYHVSGIENNLDLDNFCLLFDGCECTKNYKIKSVDINCDFRLYGSRAHFPKRLQELSAFISPKSAQINVFLINNCNFETIPDDVFAHLSIQNLILANNGLKKLTTNAFRKIGGLKRLILLEKNLNTIEEDSFQPLRNELTELHLFDLNFQDNNQINQFLLNQDLLKLKILKNLKLVNMKLKEFKLEWLPLIRNISYLALNSNQIERFDAGFFKSLPNLISLELSNNSITDLTSLLMALEPIRSSLKELKLDENSIRNIYRFPSFHNLELLDLSHNQLKEIPNFAFQNLKNLKFLYLENNRLRSLSSNFFSNSTENLLTLSLKNNLFSSVPSILNFPRLQILDLTDQNGHLSELPDYAFERYRKQDVIDNTYSLSINLESNNIRKFANKTFCSRFTNTSEIHGIMLSYKTMKNFNFCMLTQLKSHIVSRISFKVQPSLENLNANYSDVCKCELKLFAAMHNIDLTGVCTIFNTPPCNHVKNFDSKICMKKYDC